MYFNEQDTRRILDTCNDRIVEVISDFVDLTPRGSKFFGQCPSCEHPAGLEVNTAKKIFKCFKCGNVAGNSAVSFLMKAEGKSYPEALEFLNNKFLVISQPAPAKKSKTAKKTKVTSKSFCERMLAASGLAQKDVQATVFVKDENKTTLTSNVFKAGSVDHKFEIIAGDDVIIEYFDLEGAPIKYETKDAKGKYTGKYKEFFRIRYQYPEEHLDKDGKPVKYRSPYGSGSFIFIPEFIRKAFRAKQKIKTLFLQEGEKKAEKACKEGIPSVAVSGINMLGQNGRLPEDLIRIIQALEVEEVVFLFDSDYSDLSNHLKINDSVDKRPRNFFNAARSYKEYMRTLKAREIYVEIYIGHVKQNPKSDKGIDDLLANTLKETPEKLREDIEALMNKKDLTGDYIRLFKITSWTDSKLEEIWNLNNPTAFAKANYDVLKNLPEFRIGRHIWKFNDKGEIESAQPLEADEKYWEEIRGEDRHGNPKPVQYEFRYGRCFSFLQNRGYYRYRELDGKNYQFIHINHPVVRIVEPWEIRDFVIDFTKVAATEGVLEMLYRGGVQYLGPDKLSNLMFMKPLFEETSRDRQRLYFSENCFDITSSDIKEIQYTAVNYNIWSDQKREFPAKLIPEKLFDITLDENNKFDIRFTAAGERCQFLQFLVNTSNFTWRKKKQLEEGDTTVVIDPDEEYENVLHLISKIAAFGFLTLSAKDRSVSRAVVAMDGKQSEVGQSNGRSGKSILGEALKQVQKTLYIDGKKKEIESDPFIWDGLDEKYSTVFLDDVRTNFSLEMLFANITGDWNANWKGGRRFTIPFAISPKIYITTNHALNGTGSSFRDRQYLIAFSDFYNDEHKPAEDFGGLFFDDWDFDQWNLFWNLVANSLQTYIKFGPIQAPGERIETRQLRQSMGEMFLAWADEYFSDENRLNAKLNKKHLYDEYLKYSNINPKFITTTKFKNNLKAFCTWKGYIFNAHMYDPISGKPLNYDRDGRPVEDDKSGGVEYVSLYNRPVNAIDVIPVVVEKNEGTTIIKPKTDDKPF